MTAFDPFMLARGWLSVALASARDNDQRSLDRTVEVEAYHEGLRVTATDGYVLLTSFVPNVDHKPSDEPDKGVAPYATAVAMDPHGRGRSLLAHVLKLAVAEAKNETGAELDVLVRLGVVDHLDEEERNMLPGMAVHYVTLERLGIVGPASGSKARPVLVATLDQLPPGTLR